MGKVKILIADDHAVFGDSLKKALEMQEEFEVVGLARSGSEVIQKVAETCPDVVLMDIQMPGADGIRATSMIREQFPNLIILILTMHTEDRYLIEAINAGANGYLLKDMSLDEVTKSIQSAVCGNYMLNIKAVKKFIRKINEGEAEEKWPSTQLSRREVEIITLVASGLTNREIASKLYLSVSTVKNHLSNIFSKLQCSNRVELVNKITRERLGSYRK